MEGARLDPSLISDLRCSDHSFGRAAHDPSAEPCLSALMSALGARDAYTLQHSQRVAELAYQLAVTLGLDGEVSRQIHVAGLLHDIGKIGLPDRILRKRNSLNADELAAVREHPRIGFRIIQACTPLQFTLPAILHHHERWDGRGYPLRLSQHDIPLIARIIAVADAFDAMTSHRNYRSAMSERAALNILQRGAGTQWDGNIVHAIHNWHRDQERRTPVPAAHVKLLRPSPADPASTISAGT